MSSLLLENKPDIDASQHIASEEPEHLWCWCNEYFTICGIYRPDENEITLVDTNFEPSCNDCAGMTHCLYCGCNFFFAKCFVCLANWNAWKARHHDY